MAVTLQNVMDEARLDMNDAQKVRVPDTSLLSYINDAMARLYVMRPDLNYGNYGNPWVDYTTSSSLFPLPLEYRPPVCNYIVMRCEVSDDPYAIEQRAVQAMQMWVKDIGVI